jgi:hypothetical protein
LAFDFCVRYSAEDARRESFAVFVVDDACRGIDVNCSVAATRASLAALGIPPLRRVNWLSGNPRNGPCPRARGTGRRGRRSLNSQRLGRVIPDSNYRSAA